MKIIRSVFLYLLFLSSYSAADTNVKVNYSGSIKIPACDITTHNTNVELGTWLLTSNGSNFPAGSTTDWTEFELIFNCHSSMSRIAGSLQGAAASDNRSFELDKITGAATGMAIQIEYFAAQTNRWEPADANKINQFLAMKQTQAGTNSLKFRARYKQLAAKATTGKANASVTFVEENK